MSGGRDAPPGTGNPKAPRCGAAMGAVSGAMGEHKYGFVLAAGFSALLFLGLLFNWILNPTRVLLGHWIRQNMIRRQQCSSAVQHAPCIRPDEPVLH